MFKAPHLIAAAGIGLAAIPASAQAAPLMVSVPAAMPLAAMGVAQVQCHTARPAASPVAPVDLGQRASKASAILGGQPSALERLKMQQNAVGAPAASAALVPALPASSVAVPLSAMGFTCASKEQPRTVTARIAMPQVKPSVAGRGASEGRFLGTERVRIGKTRFDAQWNRVAARKLSQRDLTAAIGAVPQGRQALLSEVNRWVNREIRYKADKRDNWADAKATLTTRAGDCEDYAILKMQLLAAAGIAQDDMMLTLARDTMRRIDHAVLLVKDGNGWMMLDMQGDRVAPANMGYGYRPVMSFAGDQRYLHGKKYVAPTATKLALAK